jgi:hypothetical protein
MNSRTLLFCITLVVNTLYLNAQTGIGTTTPNASAKLDVYATNKGFLPPRVTLTSTTDATTITSPAEGLLVYNVGSVGLQAGYYYWNGANWATIATATSAGNGVTSSDLVKIYDGVGNAATINVNGVTFSVPNSGRYLFDYSTSASCTNCTLTLNFQVRDGSNNNAVIGSDMQTSWNNNVHAEYNGKVEVNLIAGRSYNVLVTASGGGGIYNNDYSRVYMKQVAGNLPVTGQSVDYGMARYTGADGSAIADNAIVPFDATASGNLTWSSNKFTLKANKTYELESSLAIYLSSGGVGGRFQIYDYTNNTSLGNGLFMSQNGAGVNNPSANSPMKAVITPTSDIQVGIRLLDHYGPNGPSIVGNAVTTGVQSAPNASYFMVKQIGSSAIVNPWVLSGTNTYNTTGNVGIGVAAPSTNLHIENGNVFGANPASTTSPSLYLYNNNNASTSAHATALVRTGGLNGGKPYIGMDVINQFGYSMGVNNPTDQFIFNTAWNFNTGTASNNAITINRSGQSRVVIPSDSGALAAGWPGGWGGGLITYDFACAGIYYTSMTARSDRRLKNTIVDLDNNSISKFLQLRPVNYYWNDGSDNHHRQYGLIAQEVEELFPDIVSIANDSMQTKSVNYQALHALSLKVIQTQQTEIEALKKKQTEFEARLLKLEAKLNQP